jgi:hypothetical protein
VHSFSFFFIFIFYFLFLNLGRTSDASSAEMMSMNYFTMKNQERLCFGLYNFIATFVIKFYIDDSPG